jgi:hypothetical protein
VKTFFPPNFELNLLSGGVQVKFHFNERLETCFHTREQLVCT